MTAIPEIRFGDGERMMWLGQVPRELYGAVVSLEKLKEIFPSEGNFSEVQVIEEWPNYRVYGRKETVGERSLSLPVAYECKKCDKIYAGPPDIRDVDDLSILSGRRGYDLYCKQNHLLKEVTLERS
jgi:hypothetical protein